MSMIFFFFKQKTAYEIGVTGVQTCALPIFLEDVLVELQRLVDVLDCGESLTLALQLQQQRKHPLLGPRQHGGGEIGRGAGGGRGEISGGGGIFKKKKSG